MKKLFIALTALIIFACDSDPYKLDLVATAKAPWGLGERLVDEGPCFDNNDGYGCYTQFLGITDKGYVLIQDFYASGHQLNSPYAVTSMDIARDAYLIGKRWDYIDGYYTTWRENGEKVGGGYYEKGKRNGPFAGTYLGGSKLYEANYRDDKKHGKDTMWDGNGVKVNEDVYEDGMPVQATIYQNGHPVYFREWDKQGNLVKEVEYDPPKK